MNFNKNGKLTKKGEELIEKRIREIAKESLPYFSKEKKAVQIITEATKSFIEGAGITDLDNESIEISFELTLAAWVEEALKLMKDIELVKNISTNALNRKLGDE